MSPVILLMAKAPVPGSVKTRLMPALSAESAAQLAAAALFDTLEVMLAVTEAVPILALAGSVTESVSPQELSTQLTAFRVIPQGAGGFAERLAAAHQRAAEFGSPVVQIGMDTPQLTAAMLRRAIAAAVPGTAALGPTTDGGWWGLGLSDPGPAAGLRRVPMSTPHTGWHTAEMLAAQRLSVRLLPMLTDVDTVDQLAEVARSAPNSRFGRLAGALRAEEISWMR